MKLLLVTESYWPNADGGALFERRLAHGMAERGHEVVIWAPGTGYRSYIENDAPTVIERERSTVLWANPKYRVSYWPFFRARKLIKQHQPDVLHIHNAGLMGLAALHWARKYHIPVVATNHFMPENALLNLPWLNNRLMHRLIWKYLVWFHNRCNFVTSPTPTAVKLLLDHGLKAPHQAITNGIDMDVFKPGLNTKAITAKYRIPTDVPNLLYLGRVDGEKRLDLIVAALPEILKQQPVHLTIAGFGKAMNDLRSQAHKLKVDHAITFTGYLNEDDKPYLYNAADVFVISSPAELQSIVTLEAMSSGLPVVSVDVAALKELCHDGQNGYLFQENDWHDLAQKVNKLLSKKTLPAQFGKESIRIIQESHSTEITFRDYEKAYNRVLGR